MNSSPQKRFRQCNGMLAMVVAAFALTACSTSPVIFSNQAPAADFSNYSSYAFAESLGTDDRENVRSLLSQFLITEISRQMNSRGYKQVDADADLIFDFALITKEKLRSVPSSNFGGYYGYGGRPGYGYYGGYGNDYRITQYTEGILTLAMIDTATKGVVWEGGGVARVTDEVRDNLQLAIQTVVGEIFTRRFPYHAPGTAPPAVAANP
jgi:hypothetical protein